MKLNCFLKEKTMIHGRLINYAVTGEPGTEKDHHPFIITIAGGPGISYDSLERGLAKPLIMQAKSKNRPTPHLFYLII